MQILRAAKWVVAAGLVLFVAGIVYSWVATGVLERADGFYVALIAAFTGYLFYLDRRASR